MSEPSIGIAAVGTYIPSTFITAAEIAAETGIPEPVIATKFGLARKPVPGPDDHTNAMALWAAQDALAGSEIAPDQIDVVLCTTEEWKEYPLWTAGIKLAYDLGARRAWAIDVQMRCGTTIGALKLARSLMLAEPDVKTVLIAGGYRNGDLVDYRNPRSRFMINLSAGGGALLLRKGYPRNSLLGTSVIVDGSFSLDVIVPAGGTMEPLTAEAIAAGRNRLDVPDPEGMKQRLDALSMQNFLRVIDEALGQSGHTRADIDYLNVLHMKRSAHDFVLRELGLREDQSFYLSDFGHIGQQDQAVSIKKGLETGRLHDGDLMVMVAAGIGYAWGAGVVQWGSN
ncbi:MAG TPA: 3-oxoacyl-ACP synthase [Chloroflexia bacterium]|jgi:3-oxoacyl-[acyl-carrier-protein] synthase-3|nr:3-oxoacyl-ACP synthase [Chloroflexia bacterium]